ncbi:MAG TPA: glycosyltransferase family 4 protein [Longimicrobium sp.]|nr:glycosyltransferase family 4 protein [Longimicrobium sp.]
MRVLLPVFEWSRAGGIEAVTVQITHAFARLGAQVDVWSVMQPGAPDVGGVAARGLAPAGRVARSVNGRWLWRRRLAREIARRASGYDLVVAGHASLLAPIREGLSGLRRRPPCWVWAYGIEVWGGPGEQVARDLAWADHVVSISRFTAEQVKAWVPAERLTVIPPLVDVETFTPAETPVERSEILIAGRMSTAERYKGHEVLFAALPKVEERLGRPVRLRVVGDGDLRPELQARAAAMGLAERVEFTGRLPLSGLLEAYRRCAVFAMPSRVERRPAGLWTGEGFGIVYLEAQACGRPVLASTDGGAPETVRPGETGLLADPANAEAVADALAGLLADPGRADQMGRAGRAFVVDNFSEARFRERLHELLTRARILSSTEE